jgi:hypothetical protein|tara:strand:+ start:4220 stop:4384 length:165 start_codon:yes stop_codon:yes gene_type:complete
MLDELYYLIKHANFSYTDVLKMPVYERKYFIDKMVKEFETRKEAMETAKSKRNI